MNYPFQKTPLFTSFYRTKVTHDTSTCCKYSSILHICGEIKAHISLWQFTHLWVKGLVYLDSVAGQCLQSSLHALPEFIFGKFNIVCILSMIKYFPMVWSRRAVQSCGISMYHHDPLVSEISYFVAPLCHSSIHRPNLWWLPHSCLVCLLVCLFPQKLTKGGFNFFFF